jgi:hypothetical protein
MKVRVPIPLGWSSQPIPPKGKWGRWARDIDTSSGRATPARGFDISRVVKTGLTSKPGYSAVHRHTDGLEYVWYSADTAYYPETGSDEPTALVTGLLAGVYNIRSANMAIPCGITAVVNGSNAEAKCLRVESGALNDVALDLAQPDGTWTATAVTSGGSLADGTYYVSICQLDKATGFVALESEAASIKTVVLSGGGGSGKITGAQAAWTPDARSTHWRFGVSQTNSLIVLLQNGSDTVKATTSYDITDISGDTTAAFTTRNGFNQTAVMPLSGVNDIVEHQGRFFISSLSSNDIYYSERDTQQWYSTNRVRVDGDGGWNSPVVGMASTSFHRIFGSFKRDTTGTSPTFLAEVETEVVDRNIGCVSRGSITVVGGTVYFMSTQGPAVVYNNAVALLGHADIVHEMKTWDWAYADRISAAEDPDNHYVCFAVPRLTNASRQVDGAANLGICDTIYRWDMHHSVWAPPLWLECTHLACRPNGAKGARTQQTFLMAMGPHGRCKRLNYGWSGGGPDDVSGTDYNGQTASSFAAESAGGAWSSAPPVGATVEIFYPTTDTNNPGVMVRRTILTSSTSQITWAGEVPTATGTEPTIRGCGWTARADVVVDLRDWIQLEDPASQLQLQSVDVHYLDLIGMESVS